ncbi:MAG: DUF402 domain-containing protein [Lachnospirales bacterium]
MKDSFKLYRKRLVPKEDVFLKDDVIIHKDNDFIITKWEAINKRKDFDRGLSIFDFKNNVKVSKIMLNNAVVHYYVDIVEYEIDETFCRTIDLLADVIIKDDKIFVLDLDEFEYAFKDKSMTTEDILKALKYLDTFLKKIYENGIGSYKEIFDKYEQKEN